MSTQVEIKSLRERVEAARAEQERESADNAARKAQKARERLKAKMLNVLAVVVEESDITILDGTKPVVEAEGFEFTLDIEGTLAHLRKCEHCSERYPRLVYSVSSLADPFIPYPHNDGFCLKLAAQTEAPERAGDRLLQALRDFIAENSYQPE